MSIQIIRNLIQREVMNAMASIAHVRFGTIDGYDPGAFAVKVKYQPTGEISGWMGIGSKQAGPGSGEMIAPVVGSQCIVGFQEGDHEAPYLAACVHDNNNPMPAGGGPKAGEFWWVHQSGAFIKLLTGGSISLSSPSSVAVTAPGMAVSGNLTVGAGATGVFSSSTGAVITVANGIIININ